MLGIELWREKVMLISGLGHAIHIIPGYLTGPTRFHTLSDSNMAATIQR